MELKSLQDELWREYDFNTEFGSRVYHIVDPVSLVVGETTHRVIDSEGVVHCVPTVGNRGCVLRWLPRDGTKPIAF